MTVDDRTVFDEKSGSLDVLDYIQRGITIFVRDVDVSACKAGVRVNIIPSKSH